MFTPSSHHMIVSSARQQQHTAMMLHRMTRWTGAAVRRKKKSRHVSRPRWAAGTQKIIFFWSIIVVVGSYVLWLTIRRRSLAWPAAEGPGPRAPTTEATSAQRQKTLRSANARSDESKWAWSRVQRLWGRGGTYCSRTATTKTALPLGLRRDGRCSCEAYRQTETASEATRILLYAERERKRQREDPLFVRRDHPKKGER